MTLRKIRWGLWILVAIAASLFALFYIQLQRPRDATADFVKSAMVGKPVPAFELPQAVPSNPALSSADLADGKPKLLNIFASWCIPCRAEAEQLEAMRNQGAEIVGVAIRDKPEDIAQFLETYGNPYSRIGRDDISQVQLSIGSSGVPETFVIDGTGRITYQHIGDVMARDVPVLMAELRKAGA